MTVKSSTRTSLKSLSAGRPPVAKASNRVLAAKHTRRIIRAHHNLNKQLAAAKARGNHAEVQSLESAINAQGGLKAYQEASIQGQATTRGGDSSIELLKWLSPPQQDAQPAPTGLSLLEVGALSTSNACSRSPIFGHIIRIDLNAQSPGITKQDFMGRPLPRNDNERFDVISLSLVLNFVPDAAGRGEMLRRTTQFLKSTTARDLAKAPDSEQATTASGVWPSLFLVLPLPCVTNSRYMTEAHLERIMNSLGYSLAQHRKTSKLYYSLWHLDSSPKQVEFRKAKLRDGKTMNNFCVKLRVGNEEKEAVMTKRKG